MKTTPKRNDAFRIRQKSRKPKEKTTLKEKQIHSLDEVKKPKEKMTLTTLKEKTTLTTLKEKQIHSQVNDTQRRLKNASKTKAFVIGEIKLTHRKNGH